MLIYRVHKAPIILLVFSLRVNTTLFIQFSLRSLSEELEFLNSLNWLRSNLTILSKKANQFFLSSSSQLFASVAPILLVETRSDANEDEADDEDLSGKVSFPKR